MSRKFFLLLSILIFRHVDCRCKNNNEHLLADEMRCTSDQPLGLFFVGADIQKVTVQNETCLKEFKKGVGGGESILYNVDGVPFVNYFLVACGNETSNFGLLPGRYFSEKSCCAINEYFDFNTKTCEKLQPSQAILNDFPNLQKYLRNDGRNGWISNKPENYHDFRSHFSEIVKKENIIRVSLGNGKYYLIDTTKKNTNYCLDLFNDEINLRIERKSVFDEDFHFKKCGRDHSNSSSSQYVTFQKRNSVINDGEILTQLSNNPDITLEEIFECSEGFVELSDKWKVSSNGNLNVTNKNMIIHRDDYCFDVKHGIVLPNVCRRALPQDQANYTNALVVNKCINFKNHDSFLNTFNRWLGRTEILQARLIPTDSSLLKDIQFSIFNNSGAGIEVSIKCPFGSKQFTGNWTFANSSIYIDEMNVSSKKYCLAESNDESSNAKLQLHYCKDNFDIFDSDLTNRFIGLIIGTVVLALVLLSLIIFIIVIICIKYCN